MILPTVKMYLPSLTGLLLLILIKLTTISQDIQNDKESSSITYTLVHRFHTVYGTSNQVNSTIDLERNTHKIQSVKVTVPVVSFDSGNRTRDKDMLKVTEAVRYPEVQFQSTRVTYSNDKLNVVGQLTFHGVTKSISFIADQKHSGQMHFVDGRFTVSLEDYNIKRPSIFGMKVKDDLAINFHVVYPSAN